MEQLRTIDRARYHAATPEWNKHMVKRILENTEYAEGGGRPEIVPADVFNRAERIRAFKTEGRREHPACNDAIKRKLVCGVCGAPSAPALRRPTRWTGKPSSTEWRKPVSKNWNPNLTNCLNRRNGRL
jgi:hypothetical protein